MSQTLIRIALLALFTASSNTWANSLTTNPRPASSNRHAAPLMAAPVLAGITQSIDTETITVSNSVSCNGGGQHTDNHYLRRFDLDGDHGMLGGFDVSGVSFAIEQAISSGGAGQPLAVNLYTIPAADALLFANLTPISSTDIVQADTTLSSVNVAVTGTVDDTVASDLVVAIFSPDGQAAGHSFFIGSNANGETAPSYIAAPDCGLTEPTAMADVGFPNMHIVMTVLGEEITTGDDTTGDFNNTSGICPDTLITSDCIEPDKASLKIKAGKVVLWKYQSAELDVNDAQLGIPTSDGLALCFYDANALELRGLDIPDGEFDKATKSGWKTKLAKDASVKKHLYKSKSATPSGVKKALLKNGKALVKSLNPPALPLEGDVVVQLRHPSTGLCLQSSFSEADVKKNDDKKFVAKSAK